MTVPNNQAPPPAYSAPAPGKDGLPPAGYLPPQPPMIVVTEQTPLTAAERGELYRSELYGRCAAGIHEPSTRFGPCGIVTAIVCFPIGLLCLLVDNERRCTVCGVRLN
ncbi:hypothetical protein EST38_g6274 [Candolleomyces aberdarensis]|uniref:Uncharacterized protein n=1 Tax=Candolleomyces aberdarensis TaxID=2316362 RepID=A0A4Q2DL23_9AGAR|nr:hypothetical protein EST38_g6274 [Candolleomyces aberdarensis]